MIDSGKIRAKPTMQHHADLKALIVALHTWRMLSISILYKFRRNHWLPVPGYCPKKKKKMTPQKSAKILPSILFQEENLECFPLRKEMGLSQMQKTQYAPGTVTTNTILTSTMFNEITIRQALLEGLLRCHLGPVLFSRPGTCYEASQNLRCLNQ